MLALSIRQPWAELILRGVKTVEYRRAPTRIIGRRFHIYAAGAWPATPAHRRELDEATRIWSRDLAMPGEGPPPWMHRMMAELFEQRDLPTGVIVGSAVIERVNETNGIWRWHLAGVERAARLRRPERHPQPVWFEPFSKKDEG